MYHRSPLILINLGASLYSIFQLDIFLPNLSFLKEKQILLKKLSYPIDTIATAWYIGKICQ